MFMPSEIARLVLGYLKDVGCTQAVNLCLTENAHLSEYVACLKQGREYPTTIAGQSLTDILQDYCQLKSKTAESIPQEMGQIVNNIEENLAQIKCLSGNGQIRTPVSTSTSSLVSTEKSSVHPIPLGIAHGQIDVQAVNNVSNDSNEPRASVDVCHISTATNTDDEVATRQNELPMQALRQKKTLVDSSTQCTDDLPSNRDCISAASLRADDNATSASSSTQTPNRYAHCSWSSTPSRKQVDFYSSPSSMVKSAMLYNFGIDAFRTPAKDRYSTDTPSKDRYLDEDGTWKSPRRKNQVPRKRLSYTPLSALKTSARITTTPDESEGHSNDNADFTVFIDKLLHNTALHEKIADNINKVVSHATQATLNNDSPAKKQATCATNEKVQHEEVPTILETEWNDRESALLPSQFIIDEQMLDVAIKDILARTEADPVFEASLNNLFDKHGGNYRDTQMLGTCSDYAASPDTHGTPLSALESNVQSTTAATPMSESADTPNTVVMSPIVHVNHEPPDSSGISVVFSNGNHSQRPNSDISSQYRTSTDQNVASPCQHIPLLSSEVSRSEPLQAISSQSVMYSQRIMHLPPNSEVNTLKPIEIACNGSLNSVQLPSTSALQNVVQLQYTNAPSVPPVPSATLPYFSNVVPTISQSKVPTIFFPFYSNTGTILGPMVTALPVSSSSALPTRASLPIENGCAAPVQYITLNLQEQNTSDVTSQPNSNSTNFTQVKIGPFQDSSSKSSTTIRSTVSAKNLPKRTTKVANKCDKQMPDKVTPCQVPQASSFVEVTTESVNMSRDSANKDCSSNLSELLCITSTDPGITLYGQNMQEHYVDSLSVQKIISNTSISVAGNLLGLTPAKSSSTMQFVTLSPGPILGSENATRTSPKQQTLNMAINNSKPDDIQRPIRHRANILRRKPTKYKAASHEATGTGKDVSGVSIIHKSTTEDAEHQKIVPKPFDFGGHASGQKPAGKKQMQMVASNLNSSLLKNAKKTTQQQTSNKVESMKSPDCRVVAITKNVRRSMPVLENMKIVQTTLSSRCTGSSEKSPQLTSLIQTASLLKSVDLAQGGGQGASHVRTLDFGGPMNPAGKEDSQEQLHSNEKSCNSESKSKEANTTKKTKTKRKDGKDVAKNCQNVSKRKGRTRSGCKGAQTFGKSEEESSTLKNGTAKAVAEDPISSPGPKKRTARQANLSQNIRTRAKKSKDTVPGKVLSVMDIERFLSGLHYEQ